MQRNIIFTVKVLAEIELRLRCEWQHVLWNLIFCRIDKWPLILSSLTDTSQKSQSWIVCSAIRCLVWIRQQWTYKQTFSEASKESFSTGPETLLLLRESGFNMELSGWSVCVSNVIEFFQEQPNKTEKTIDGSVHGQRRSKILEADSYFYWFSLGRCIIRCV